MITLPWIKIAPWAIAGIMTVSAIGAGKMYLSERDAFVKFKAEVKTLGEVAEREKQAIEKERNANLEKVKEYEKNLPAIRNAAVAAYRLRYPNASCSAVSRTTASVKMDDGASKESMDAELIQNCSDDAAKVEAWRTWSKLNSIPIE